MNNIRCSQCGFLNFTTAESCKRCGAALGDAADTPVAVAIGGAANVSPSSRRCPFCGHETSATFCPLCRGRVEPPAASHGGVRPAGGGSGLSFAGRAAVTLTILAVLGAVVFVAGSVAYRMRTRIWHGQNGVYAETIVNAEQFKRPVTVRVNQSPMPIPFGAGAAGVPLNGHSRSATEAAFVLEARGLVSFDVSTTERIRQVATAPNPFIGPAGDVQVAPTTTEVVEKVDRLAVSLTPQGQQEAAGWAVVDEPLSPDGGSRTMRFWRVPIGERGLERIARVGDLFKGPRFETCEVEFYWSWTPNRLGEAFDTDGGVYPSLPDIPREAARALDWSTSKEYRGVARFERLPGGKWAVAEMKFYGAANSAPAP